MRNLLIFLFISMMADIYAMVPAPRLSEAVPKVSSKHKYLNKTTRSASVSPNSSPSRSSKESDIAAINMSKKSAKLTKSYGEVPVNHGSIGHQLLRAVAENNTFAVESILHLDVNIVDQLGKTPLILTIQNDNDDVVKYLLEEKNIDVNKADMCGNTPLHYAASRCNETIIKLLLYDYRVNAFLQNKKDEYAHQMLGNTTKKLSLEPFLLARLALDTIIIEKVRQLQINNMTHIDTDCMNTLIEVVKSRFGEYKHSKDDQVQTEAPKLPIYVTNEFIRKMVLYRMQQEEILQNK